MIRTAFGDLLRLVAYFFLYHRRRTIIGHIRLAIDDLLHDPAYAPYRQRVSNASIWLVARARQALSLFGWAAIILALGIAGSIFLSAGAATQASPGEYWMRFGRGFVVLGGAAAIAALLVSIPLAGGEAARVALTVVLVAIRHGGQALKAALPQIIVGRWDATPILREAYDAAKALMQFVWTVVIAALSFVILALLTGAFASPPRLILVVLLSALAGAWSMRWSRDPQVLKIASALLIAAALVVVVGAGGYEMYTHTDGHAKAVTADLRRECIDEYYRNGVPNDPARVTACEGVIGTNLLAVLKDFASLSFKNSTGTGLTPDEEKRYEALDTAIKAALQGAPAKIVFAKKPLGDCENGKDDDGNGYKDGLDMSCYALSTEADCRTGWKDEPKVRNGKTVVDANKKPVTEKVPILAAGCRDSFPGVQNGERLGKYYRYDSDRKEAALKTASAPNPPKDTPKSNGNGTHHAAATPPPPPAPVASGSTPFGRAALQMAKKYNIAYKQ
jgi:hypothetical protein